MGITACNRCAAAARISATTRTKPVGISIVRYRSVLPTYRDGLHHHVGGVAARREAAKLQRCSTRWRGGQADQKSGLTASGRGNGHAVGRNKPPGPAFGRPDDKLRALHHSNRLMVKNQHRRAQRHATSRYGGTDRLARTQAARWVRTLAASRGFRTGMAQCAEFIIGPAKGRTRWLIAP